jgi:hypothetical protein
MSLIIPVMERSIRVRECLAAAAESYHCREHRISAGTNSRVGERIQPAVLDQNGLVGKIRHFAMAQEIAEWSCEGLMWFEEVLAGGSL